MTAPWKTLHNPIKADIISPEGTVRCSVLVYGGNNLFIVDDVKNADIRIGDEIRTPLPNGREEAFTVLDPKYYDTKSIFPAHYQIKVERKNNFPKHQGGFYNISVNGNGSRVNISSTDNSVNNAENVQKFEELMQKIIAAEIENEVKANLLQSAAQMQSAKKQEDFSSAYQKFVASAANHMTIITPFLPFLTNILAKLSINT
ncbi:hypothetical protein ACJRO0_13055 [Acetobacter oryzifermentans]|uniref:hypothetical protein n=1 Tax=Acetobacter oryzifermentans TaxID=1633874 RepID=UPI0039BF228F